MAHDQESAARRAEDLDTAARRGSDAAECAAAHAACAALRSPRWEQGDAAGTVTHG